MTRARSAPQASWRIAARLVLLLHRDALGPVGEERDQRSVDGLAARVCEHLWTYLAGKRTHRNGAPYTGLVVYFQRALVFGRATGATPDGRTAGEPLSESISPSQGVDTRGPTATLNSIASTKCAQYKERAARLLNMKLSPASVVGEEGTRKLMALIRAVCDMKMWHVQFNIINKETLIAAQEDPEKYKDLLVRVAGYSAFFVELCKDIQDEIISRTPQGKW